MVNKCMVNVRDQNIHNLCRGNQRQCYEPLNQNDCIESEDMNGTFVAMNFQWTRQIMPRHKPYLFEVFRTTKQESVES